MISSILPIEEGLSVRMDLQKVALSVLLGLHVILCPILYDQIDQFDSQCMYFA